MRVNMVYLRDNPPKTEGWYIVVACWDPEEGGFPSVAYWDGGKWDRDEPFIERSEFAYGSESDADAAEQTYDYGW